jgi:hypothetical protein
MQQLRLRFSRKTTAWSMVKENNIVHVRVKHILLSLIIIRATNALRLKPYFMVLLTNLGGHIYSVFCSV